MVALISDFHMLDIDGNFLVGRRNEGIMRKTEKNGLNRRNKGGVGRISLPSASVSFRGRTAVVSLISDFIL